jgi:hypothetical protein
MTGALEDEAYSPSVEGKSIAKASVKIFNLNSYSLNLHDPRPSGEVRSLGDYQQCGIEHG